MKSLVVLCPYPEGVAPSQRFKFEQYYADWRRAGWDVDVRPFWDRPAWEGLYSGGGTVRKGFHFLRGLLRRAADLRAARRADLVYLHLEAIPVGPPVIERALSRAGVPIVYDIDDLIQLPHSSRANRFMRWLRSPQKVPELMGLADHVIVCTEHLLRLTREENPAATNISSTIDSDRYVPIEPRAGTEEVVVGWSGSHSTAPYLHLLDEVLIELQRTDGVGVRVIGDPEFAVDGLAVEALPWRAETEVSDLSGIDIGVYPLPDEEWVLGKSGLKLLQYMGMGIPSVAERLGTNLEIVEHGTNGYLVRGEEEWLEALRALVRDPGLRARKSASGRATVEARYSVRANAQAYRSVLEAAVGASG